MQGFLSTFSYNSLIKGITPWPQLIVNRAISVPYHTCASIRVHEKNGMLVFVYFVPFLLALISTTESDNFPSVTFSNSVSVVGQQV